MGVVLWLALLESGVDPVVAGLAIGLAASAYTPTREGLEGATALFRTFREEPTPELARSASVGVIATLSPNARLQRFYVPWTTYVIVPLFGLANAGFVLDGDLLARAAGRRRSRSGIVLGYLVGKPAGVLLASWAVTRLSRGRDQAAGRLARRGRQRHHRRRRLHRLAPHRDPGLRRARSWPRPSSASSPRPCFALVVTVGRLPARHGSCPPTGGRGRCSAARRPLLDLAEPFDDSRDHYRGRRDASVILYEYGDFECPHCGLAEPAARAELDTRRRPALRLAPPAADRRPPARPARRRGVRGGRQAGRVLAAARPAAHPPGAPDAGGPAAATPATSGSTSTASPTTSTTTCTPTGSPRDIDSADRSGVSGTPDLLRQRPAPLRRVRRRLAPAGRRRRPRAPGVRAGLSPGGPLGRGRHGT